MKKAAAYPLMVEVETETAGKQMLCIGRLSGAVLLELAEAVLGRKRVRALRKPPTATVKEFVETCLVRADEGAAATSAELFAAYGRFCRAKRWTPLTELQAERAFVRAIREAHGVSRRNDVRRGGAPRRGYSVRIKPMPAGVAGGRRYE